MRLWIPHSSSLNQVKEANNQIFGRLESEFCIKSTDFRSKATKLCMEYRKDPELQHMCERILDRASKYNVQLLELDNEGKRTIRQSMSPIIFSNVGRKKMQADTSSTLGTIRRETSASIVSTLLDLQEHGRYDDWTYDWIENMEVIYLNTSGGSRKRRRDDEVVARNCGKRLLWRPPPNQPSSHDA